MKPTVRVIITSPNETDSIEFVKSLSESEIVEHEKKVPNPLSATKEEALLLPRVGRLEWENLSIQMYALVAARRYDFAWPALLREVYGVIVLVDGNNTEAVDETRQLVKLFAMMEQPNCLVAVRQHPGAGPAQAEGVQARLRTAYPIVHFIGSERDEVEKVLRAWIDIVPPPEEPVRRRSRSNSKTDQP